MEKFIREYGVVILLYLVIIVGVLTLNARIKTLKSGPTNEISFTQKAFTNE